MFDPKIEGEKANALIEQLNQAKNTENQALNADSIVEAVTDTDTQSNDPGVQNAQESLEVKPADTTVSTELAALRKQVESADQKWKVLQGMINKKDEELETLRELLAKLSSNPAPVVEDTSQEVGVTDKDREEYDATLIDMVTRISGVAARSEIAKLRQEIEKRFGKLEGNVQNVESTVAKSAQEVFFDRLTAEVPTWRDTNVSPQFLDWLEIPEELSGIRRMDILTDAVSKGDIRRTVTIFKAFEALQNPAKTVVEEPPVDDRKKNLEKLVAPGKPKTSSVKASGDKRVWRSADISKLYSDKRAGRITGAEFNELERDLFAAQAEGRVAA